MSKDISRQEFIELYGEEEVTFTYYYKYTFYYEGKTEDGVELLLGYGGDSGDIYRDEIHSGEKQLVKNLCASSGTASKDNQDLYYFTDY